MIILSSSCLSTITVNIKNEETPLMNNRNIGYTPSNKPIGSLNVKDYDEYTNYNQDEDYFFGYIIQFFEEPIFSYQNKFDFTSKDVIDNKTIQISEHKNKIFSQHQNAKSDISQRLGNEKQLEDIVIAEYTNIFNGIAINGTPEDMEIIRNSPFVRDIFPNYQIKICLNVSVPLINADTVWELQDDNKKNITGDGVTIAIIDTGIDYNHTDFGGGFGLGYKVVDGYDFVNTDSDPMDDHGHGTHCAGIAAGTGESADRKFVGVAPDAKLYAYKVLNQGGSGWSTGVIEGIERAIDPNNDGDVSDHVDIISMSLGGEGDQDDPLCQAVDNAVECGVIVVVSAGNDGPNNYTITSPGIAKKAITVGASTHIVNSESTGGADKITYYSSRGPNLIGMVKPDIVAPGGDVYLLNDSQRYKHGIMSCRAYNTSLGNPINEYYTKASGTSMACPHVAGAAALLLQKNPGGDPEDIKSALKVTAVDLGYDAITQGSGRIDVLKAINTPFLIQPSTIEIGKVKPFIQKNTIINISNQKNTTLQLQLAIINNNPDVDITIDQNSITIPAYSIKTVTISSIVINDSPPYNEFYFGYLEITNDQNISRIPYSFSKITDKLLNGFRYDSGDIIANITELFVATACLEASDFDNDKDIDFLAGIRDDIYLYINKNCVFTPHYICSLPNSAGGFVDRLSSGGFTSADYNNDGFTDFICGGVQGVIRLFLNEGYDSEQKIDDDFVPEFRLINISSLGQTAYGLTSADFDNDGDTDFIVSYSRDGIIELALRYYKNNDSGNFTDMGNIYQRYASRIASLDSGDFDNDGDTDLIISYSETVFGDDFFKDYGIVEMLTNNGNMTFQDGKIIARRGEITQGKILPDNRVNPHITSADYDKDGDLDLKVGDNSGKVEFYSNNGFGTFTSNGIIYDFGSISWGLTSEDFDGDGDIDFLVAAAKHQYSHEGNIYLKKNLITRLVIIKPQKGGLYFFDKKLQQFQNLKRTIIIGKINIEIDVQQPISKMEIYNDNRLLTTIEQPPYQWTWKRGSIIKHKHTLKIIIYDDLNEEIDSEKIQLWKFV